MHGGEYVYKRNRHTHTCVHTYARVWAHEVAPPRDFDSDSFWFFFFVRVNGTEGIHVSWATYVPRVFRKAWVGFFLFPSSETAAFASVYAVR